MADHDLVNPTTGETAIQSVDRMAGRGGNPPHPSAPPPNGGPGGNARPAPVNTKPIAPRTYGAPVGNTILK